MSDVLTCQLREPPWLVFGVIVLLLAMAGVARATPRVDKAPDPRRGETLDGRPRATDPYRIPLAVPRALLAVPRLALRVIFKPVTVLAEVADRRFVVQRLMAPDRNYGVRPSAAYGANVLWLGLGYYDERILGPGSRVEVRASVGGTARIIGQLLVRPWRRLGMRLNVQQRNDTRFGGVRGETSAELRAAGREVARFGYGRMLVEVWHGRAIAGTDAGAGSFALQLRGQLDTRTFSDGAALGGERPIREVWGDPMTGDVDPTLVPGWGTPLRRLRGGATLTYDSRERIRFDHGVMLAFDALVAEGFAGDPSRDATFAAEVRAPFSFGDRSIILRGATAVVERLGDAPVPFVDLVSPIGDDGLRGYPTGRLRGASMAVVGIEYRWLAGSYVDASLFVDYGGAFGERYDGFSSAHLRPTGGFGLTLYNDGSRHERARPAGAFYVSYNEDEGVRLFVSAGN